MAAKGATLDRNAACHRAATGCAATSERRSTGEVIDDTTITTKVKANLLADPVVSLFAISVETSRGVVSLTGIVNSTGERAQAIHVAQETGGVRRSMHAICMSNNKFSSSRLKRSLRWSR